MTGVSNHSIHPPRHVLHSFRVPYRVAAEGPQVQVFQCAAEDVEHAQEQCRNAYPDAELLSVGEARPTDPSEADHAWLAVGSFDGRIEVWRGGVFEDEDEAREAFAAHIADVGHEFGELRFLHAIRVALDADGLPRSAAPDVDADPEPTEARFYAIASTHDPRELWSNSDGWTSGPGFTVFSASDRSRALPVGGQWVRLRLAPL